MCAATSVLLVLRLLMMLGYIAGLHEHVVEYRRYLRHCYLMAYYRMSVLLDILVY